MDSNENDLILLLLDDDLFVVEDDDKCGNIITITR